MLNPVSAHFFAALSLLGASSGPDATAVLSDVEISIAIPQYGEAFSHAVYPRKLRWEIPDALFDVVIRNTSNRPLDFFTDGNSWGDYTLSFNITASDGSKWMASKTPHGYSRNFPGFVRLMPGEVWVRGVAYKEPLWTGFARAHEKQGQAVRIQAVLSQSDQMKKADPDIWSGQVLSPALSVTFDR